MPGGVHHADGRLCFERAPYVLKGHDRGTLWVVVPQIAENDLGFSPRGKFFSNSDFHHRLPRVLPASDEA
jgi:hypothetical protein